MDRLHLRNQQFVDRYINVEVLKKSQFRRYSVNHHLQAFVVGSDQVWRPKYNDPLDICFLGFTEGLNVKRIAYAASFGVDNWEYSESETLRCSDLAADFNAISVREESAIELCKDYFHVKAKHVLDPTMLLDVDDYLNLIHEDVSLPDNMIFVYFLDYTPEKKTFVERISKQMNLEPYYFMPEVDLKNLNDDDDLDAITYKSIEDWLSCFHKCKFVVCDSFHGTVFSIIFNKPFYVIGNEERGNARFDSLLNMFNLQERLVCTNITDIKEPLIDWNRINEIRVSQQIKSINFLKQAL